MNMNCISQLKREKTAQQPTKMMNMEVGKVCMKRL